MNNCLNLYPRSAKSRFDSGLDLGFTFLEILVVLIIIGLVSGSAIPLFVDFLEGRRERASLERFVESIKLAEFNALTTGRRTALIIEPTSYGYCTLGSEGWQREKNLSSMELSDVLLTIANTQSKAEFGGAKVCQAEQVTFILPAGNSPIVFKWEGRSGTYAIEYFGSGHVQVESIPTT